MKIYVVRHGLSEGNAAGVIQGYSDCSLTDVGKAQASLLGRYFNREIILPEVIFASPLRRALQTAENIANEIDPRPRIEPDESLKEVDVGTLSGCSIEDAYSKCPEWAKVDVNRWLDFSAAGGESFEGFYKRVTDSISKKMEGWDLLADRTIIFVTHAGTMRPLLKTLLAAESDMMYFSFGNCSHVKIEYRKVNDSIRRVLTDLLTIQNIAGLMGEGTPTITADDPVGKKIG